MVTYKRKRGTNSRKRKSGHRYLNRSKKQRKYTKSKRFVGGAKKSRASRVSAASRLSAAPRVSTRASKKIGASRASASETTIVPSLPPNEEYKILESLYGTVSLLNGAPIGYLIDGELEPPTAEYTGATSMDVRACRFTRLNGSPSLVIGEGMVGCEMMPGIAFSNALETKNYIEVAKAKGKFVKIKVEMDPQDSSIINGDYYFLKHDPGIEFEHEGKYNIRGADIYIAEELFKSTKPNP